jgi:SynChlorMet cassette radical SAM/SPASM protein ScmF
MADRKIQLPEGIPPLNTYYVYLTGGCNLACRHCWISPSYEANGGTGGHLAYDLFALAIEEGLPLGLRDVKLTGGEPLLHPDFVRIVDFLREKELGLTIETNGTLLTDSLAHYLREKSTLGFISVSLDGACAETHDSLRGVKGSFEQALRGIRYLVDVGYSPQVIMSIHAGNAGEMEALVKLAESLRAGSVKFNLIQPTGRGRKMNERGQTLDIERLIGLGKWVDGDLQRKSSLRLFYSWPLAFYRVNKLLTFDSYTCNIHNILGILHTGQLSMCGIGVEVEELCYGVLGEDRVADIWNSNPILLDLRKQIPGCLSGVCSECILRTSCLGTCIAHNYNLSGQLTSPYWFCQEASEQGFFPLTRFRKM